MDTKIYKKLKVHNINKFPEGEDYSYYDLSQLSDDNLDDLVLLDIDECWYWYAVGGYEGTGKILMRKGNLYDFGSLGHCSCYGPTENKRFNGKKICEIEMSQEFEKSIKGLKKFAGII